MTDLLLYCTEPAQETVLSLLFPAIEERLGILLNIQVCQKWREFLYRERAGPGRVCSMRRGDGQCGAEFVKDILKQNYQNNSQTRGTAYVISQYTNDR